MKNPFPFPHLNHCVVAIALLVFAIPEAVAQETATEPTTLPFTVKQGNGGLEVVSYNRSDGLLRAGDIISVVARSPGSDKGIEVTTPASLESGCIASQDANGFVTLLIWRDALPIWLAINLTTSGPPEPRQFPFTVKPSEHGLEIVTYRRTDGLLQPGDIIGVVRAPGSDDYVQVKTPDSLMAECVARQDAKGTVVLFVTRVNSYWVAINLRTSGTPEQRSVPFTTRPASHGLEVVTYNRTDGLLQPGDIISWVLTPGTENSVQVKTPAGLEQQAVAKQDKNRDVYFYVERANAQPKWVLLKLSAKNVPQQQPLPFTVRQGNENVEVVTYDRTDGLLQPGDIISWVLTPGTENSVQVKTPAGLAEQAVAKQDKNRDVYLYVERANAQPKWVLLKLDSKQTVTAEKTRKIHIVLCGLTDDPSIGKMIAVSFNALKDKLKSNIDEKFIGSFQTLTGADCNAKSVLNAVNSIKAAPQDGVFFYYAGHGAYDPNRSSNDLSKGHFLQIPGGDLMRKQVYDQVISKRVRFSVLITDTCNVRAVAQPIAMAESRVVEREITGLTPLERLLLTYRGQIDISGSDRDQYGWFSTDIGGWFTYKLTPLLVNSADWVELMNSVSPGTNELFQQYKQLRQFDTSWAGESTLKALQEQQAQTPVAFGFRAESDPYDGGMADQKRTIELTYTVSGR